MMIRILVMIATGMMIFEQNYYIYIYKDAASHKTLLVGKAEIFICIYNLPLARLYHMYRLGVKERQDGIYHLIFPGKYSAISSW